VSWAFKGRSGREEREKLTSLRTSATKAQGKVGEWRRKGGDLFKREAVLPVGLIGRGGFRRERQEKVRPGAFMCRARAIGYEKLVVKSIRWENGRGK